MIFCGFSAATLAAYPYFHADARFVSFTEDFFLQELRSDPLQFHYAIDNPSAFGVDETALCMPVYRAGDAASDAYALSVLSDRLDSFAHAHLSQANRRLYELLDTYLGDLRRTAAYPYFAEPLSPSSGAVSELPLLLAEYRLDDRADIEQYFAVLEQIPDYLDGLITYEQEKAAAGLFMADATADKVIRQCADLMDADTLDAGTHFLETTFDNRLQTLVDNGVITASERDGYRSNHRRLLVTVVAPAYDRVADELTILKGSGGDIGGLARYAGGREYYEALLHLTTGSSRSVDGIRQLLYNDLSEHYGELMRLLQADESLNGLLTSDPAYLPQMTPEAILEHLQEAIAADYPAIPADTGTSPPDCTVKYVDAALAPYSAPAFYMTPPIDNIGNNTIYINESDISGDLSLFTTLAHEGYPGHLYQTVYSRQHWAASGVTPLRSILSYGGYVEGWAMYAEMNAYDYAVELAGESYPEAAACYRACRLDRQIQLCLYSLLDIAIHYDGASLQDVTEILTAFGFTDPDTIAAVYAYIAEEPCNYPKYYAGYLEIMELKRQAAKIWLDRHKAADPGAAYTLTDIYRDRDFLRSFHRFLLENGPADFATLSKLLGS